MSRGGQPEPQPARWHSTNLVGMAAPLLASTLFNAHPQPLRIASVREQSPGLFALLEGSADAAQARDVFGHFMKLAFTLLKSPAEPDPVTSPRRWRASYLKLLQGWGLDANGPAGAVLKGWVESRFGIVPIFHKAPLQRFPSAAWLGYLEEKASARWNNNNIFQQLDLLYEYCQWVLARFGLPGAPPGARVTLWRGSLRCEEQVVAGSLRERRCTVRLNNIVSFSRSREQAGCFGDWILRAEVPLCKLVFIPGLVATHALSGEDEVLALGGDYEVQASYG